MISSGRKEACMSKSDGELVTDGIRRQHMYPWVESQ
jgi:hypothetical protein